MKLLLLLPFLPGLLIAQQAQSGTDIYLNSKANFICQQIEQSETAIEDMHSRQASMLTIKKGLEPANESIRHQKKLEKKGIKNHLYDGYLNLYLSQACSDYNRLFAIFNIQHQENKLKRKRFIELHNFTRDLMQADSISNIKNYVNDNKWDIFKNKLQPKFNKLQNLRWTASLKIVPEWRTINRFTIQLIDIKDINHIFELDIVYNLDKASKISEVLINEYTKEHPKVEIVETTHEIPSGKQ
ncbi:MULTISPECIES: hypothetical protein [Mesoflavibacter]|uniref:Uncharacterized protein n=1 Tax=Mesoflavibacter profundi TaxID=2708110 RepID=A0ABT4S003_9FLAO|nr:MULTISPECIES: hypothetical protein [Mesoflavibacter]MDA0177405.1 hypothetical protein [Mesoflavibacter profundi]QIJ88358.1 hypothetical protein C7H62_0549 [Mesoflavibacter sp. HG96]QIJ91086.1 hypothetical protein C7H56_0549 [Mesoflavibacter sp. HG37]